MEKWKKEYENIKVPDNMTDKIEETVARAQRNKKKIRTVRMWKRMGSAAAVLVILLVLPNTSRTAAAAMQQIPILGDFFKVVTIREYQVEEERYIADVKVPEVVPDKNSTDEGGISEKALQQAQETADEINFDIQKATDELIEEFKKNMEEYEDGYQDIYIDSKVLTDNDQWFSLELILYQGAGSGYEQHRHYTIDKKTGKRAELSDFYGENYVDVISEEVKSQMRSQMAADENVIYWLDNEEIPEWNFKKIAEAQDFYVNADGHVVICFDEYEVAPGYMGCVEFVLQGEV